MTPREEAPLPPAKNTAAPRIDAPGLPDPKLAAILLLTALTFWPNWMSFGWVWERDNIALFPLDFLDQSKSVFAKNGPHKNPGIRRLLDPRHEPDMNKSMDILEGGAKKQERPKGKPLSRLHLGMPEEGLEPPTRGL